MHCVPHLAVVERVRVVAVAGVLLVAVEPVIVGLVQQTRGRGGQTLDSVRVLGVLVVGLVLLGLGTRSQCLLSTEELLFQLDGVTIISS